MPKKSEWDKIVEGVRKMAGSRTVKVGIFGAKGGNEDDGGVSVLELATIHEFGAPGAGIPERSFIRAGVRALQKTPEFAKIVGKLGASVFKGPGPRERALGILGVYASNQVKKYVTKGKNLTPLKPATIKAKGSSRPLVDTGRMVNSITYVVEDSKGTK